MAFSDLPSSTAKLLRLCRRPSGKRKRCVVVDVASIFRTPPDQQLRSPGPFALRRNQFTNQTARLAKLPSRPTRLQVMQPRLAFLLEHNVSYR
jgi:hypothetical protein